MIPADREEHRVRIAEAVRADPRPPVNAGVVAALRAEAGRLSAEMAVVRPAQWSRPTGCPPWTVAELLGHVVTVLAWIPDMLAAPAPERAEIDAAGYYRADDRFSDAGNAARVELARDRAARAGGGPALAASFHRTWRHVLTVCERERADRVVRTRHGDPMLLGDFLLTRVVEVGVHGLDLAAALGRRPWLTPEAAGALSGLLLSDGIAALERLGWDPVTFVRKASGRGPLTAADRERAEAAGIRWLALG